MTILILLTILPSLLALAFIAHALLCSTHRTGRWARRGGRK